MSGFSAPSVPSLISVCVRKYLSLRKTDKIRVYVHVWVVFCVYMFFSENTNEGMVYFNHRVELVNATYEEAMGKRKE